jgi:hypothetical protein
MQSPAIASLRSLYLIFSCAALGTAAHTASPLLDSSSTAQPGPQPCIHTEPPLRWMIKMNSI